MKQLHRLALLALASVAVPLGTAAAQTAPAAPAAPASQDATPDARHSPEARLQHRLDALTRKLNLTPAQQDQIKPILADAETQGKAVFADASFSKDDKRAKLKELHETANGKIRAVLTPEQQATFDTLKEHVHHAPPAS